MLKDHGISRSMSGKGGCLTSLAGMQVGETFKAVKVFERKFCECICSFNKERIYWRERVQFNAGLVPCADAPSGAWGLS